MKRLRPSARARKPRPEVVEDAVEEDIKPDLRFLNPLAMAPLEAFDASGAQGPSAAERNPHAMPSFDTAESPPDIKPELDTWGIVVTSKDLPSPVEVKPNLNEFHLGSLGMGKKPCFVHTVGPAAKVLKAFAEIAPGGAKQEAGDEPLAFSDTGFDPSNESTFSKGLWGSIAGPTSDRKVQEERFMRFRVPRKPRITGAELNETPEQTCGTIHVEQDPIVIHTIAVREYVEELAAIVDEAKEKHEKGELTTPVERPTPPPEMEDPVDVAERLMFPPEPLTASLAKQIVWKAVSVLSAFAGYVDADPGVVDVLTDITWDYMKSLCSNLKKTQERMAFGVFPQIDPVALVSVVCEATDHPGATSTETLLDWYNRTVAQTLRDLMVECEELEAEFGRIFGPGLVLPEKHEDGCEPESDGCEMGEVFAEEQREEAVSITIVPHLPLDPDFEMEQTLQCGNSWQERKEDSEENIPLDSALDMIEEENSSSGNSWVEATESFDQFMDIPDEGPLMPEEDVEEEEFVFPDHAEHLPVPSPLVRWTLPEDEWDDLYQQPSLEEGTSLEPQKELKEKKKKRSKAGKSDKRSRKKKSKAKSSAKS